ncbi:MAG: hypothetical protein IJW97_02720 [Clostridia bacterium]|nr:hypothetical protein [Clostridia bacterium]
MKDMQRLLNYIDYYIYSFASERICIAEGTAHDAAQEIYSHIIRSQQLQEDEVWAFDIALDCIREMSELERAILSKEGTLSPHHFGYGLRIRNKYLYPAKCHVLQSADEQSEQVLRAILIGLASNASFTIS